MKNDDGTYAPSEQAVETVKQPTSGSPSERRRSERILIPFPAVVEGVDVDGLNFKVDTVLDNLSKGGLYLRVVPCMSVGTKLSVVFRLSGSVDSEATSPKIAIRGEVLRVDMKEGGACGIAVRYDPARFI
jgi:hypothetical protein